MCDNTPDSDGLTREERLFANLITTVAQYAGLHGEELDEWWAGLDTIVADIMSPNDIPDVLRALADTIDYQINLKDYPGRNRTSGLPRNL